MEHPELPLFSFFSALLILVPLPWHWRAGNTATLSIIAWLFLVNVIYGVNSIIWAGNVEDVVPVWCDISSKIVFGASYVLPLATLCVCKHLETVSSSRKVSFDYAYQRRRMVFEASMCFGLPLVFMALHYIVQGHRFDIFENIGCQAAIYVSIPAILIIWLPRLLFSAITMIYATVALHHFIRRRLIFASHLRNSDPTLTTNCFLRLIAMTLTETVWVTILTSYNLYNDVTDGLRPWTTWTDVHSNIFRVDQFPEMTTSPEFLRVMIFWWMTPVSSLIFLLFFGFGEEAKKEHAKTWHWIKINILHLRPPEKEMINSKALGSRTLKPLRLVDQKNSSTKFPIISHPILISSSNPSLHMLVATSPTKWESQDSQLNAIQDNSAIHTFNVFTSIHAQPSGLTCTCHPSIRRPLTAATDVIDQPPQLPEIPLSLPLFASLPSSPALSVSESVGPTFYRSPSRPGCLPSPTYRRPFCGPSIYPVTRHHPNAQQGIMVTVHRQASVDDVV